MGPWTQKPPTPLQTGNTTVSSMIHGMFKQVSSIMVDMCFHWLKDRSNMGCFYIYWDKGKNNLGYYYKKNHPPWHYYKMRPIVLNNPPDTRFHLSKGVLVVPQRLKQRATIITVNRKDKTIIEQRNKVSDYLSKLYK